jgi:hypothetical protein
MPKGIGLGLSNSNKDVQLDKSRPHGEGVAMEQHASLLFLGVW